jgi:hypothetical protein
MSDKGTSFLVLKENEMLVFLCRSLLCLGKIKKARSLTFLKTPNSEADKPETLYLKLT